MSQEKAQLIAPIDSSFTVPGLTVSGVITATSLDGTITGVANSITQGKNLNVGVVTALSFAGNLTGNAGGLIGSPNTVAGVVTATSFIGGLTGNITGDVIGNASGIGASIKQGVNLNVGVATASTWYGDASGVTGAGVTAFIAQEVTGTTDETIVNLTHGNLIYYKGIATTVGFASTAATQEVTIVRDTSSTFTAAYNESISTGGVTFDGTGDYLSMDDNATFQLGTDDWTIECFWKSGSGNTGNYQQLIGTQTEDTGTTAGIWRVGTRTNSDQIYFSRADGSGFEEPIWDVDVNDEEWHHLAFTRESGSVYCYVDGVKQTNVGESNAISGSMTSNDSCYIGYNTRDGTYITGTVSNARIVKGTAVYTANFLPPSAELTNITNTGLLCCQSTSSTTAKAVGPTITANGDPAAGAQTVAYSGTNTLNNGTITWPDRVTWTNNVAGGPTLITNARGSAFQVFRFVSADTGLTYKAWEEMKNDSQNLSFWSFGYNTLGSIGVNDRTARSSPTQLPGNWKTLGGGSDSGALGSMAAINQDDELWVWGRNYRYQLGLSNTTLYSSPVQLPGSWSSVTLSAACHGVKTDGTLWSWGYGNTGGAMGQNEGNVQRSSPKQVGTDTDWSHVGKSGGGIQGIKTDGTLWIAGSSSGGRLGLNQGPGNNRSSPTQLPGTWSKAFGCSDYYGGLKTDGTLWAWASGSSGQLGQNATTPQSSPVQIPGTWSDCAGAYNANSGVKTDGTLWTWGNNQQAQLGHNNKTQYSSPKQLPGTTWRSVNMGYDWTIATKTDGTAWGWGSGAYGRIGTNAPYNTNYSSPIQIGTNTDWSDQIRVGQRVTALLKLS